MNENEFVSYDEKGINLEQLNIGKSSIEQLLSENLSYAETVISEAVYQADTAQSLV